jgi:hypothetical protein
MVRSRDKGKSKSAVCVVVVVFCFFFYGQFQISNINRKQYKPVLQLQAEGGFRARVKFVLCGLPTSN